MFVIMLHECAHAYVAIYAHMYVYRHLFFEIPCFFSPVYMYMYMVVCVGVNVYARLCVYVCRVLCESRVFRLFACA